MVTRHPIRHDLHGAGRLLLVAMRRRRPACQRLLQGGDHAPPPRHGSRLPDGLPPPRHALPAGHRKGD